MHITDAEECFTAALLQDMAVPLLLEAEPEAYGGLLETRAKNGRRLSDLEWETFRWTHAEAGQFLARWWKLPESLAVLVGSHHTIDRWISRPEKCSSKAVVALSSLLPASIDTDWSEFDRFESCCEKVIKKSGPPLALLLKQIDSQCDVLSKLMRLPSPRPSLAAAYREYSANHN
jgi:HD-like signal output (HDOD) protein